MVVALQATDLAVGYRTPVVEHISLALHTGEVMALIGPNGSGKSTLLKTLARRLKPISGSIALFGQDIASLPPTRLAQTVAVMDTVRPQTDLLTCLDVVEAGRYPYTGTLGILSNDDHEVVRTCMEVTRTWGLRDRDFMQLSDGQRQRALVARALCQEPNVFILDEPTSYLDIASQLELLQLLRDQAASTGMAVIMALHEIDLAQKAADTVVALRQGGLYASGRPEDVLTQTSMTKLYGLSAQAFNPQFGSFELAPPKGDARVFVIAGGGTGAATFRALQRAGVPFAAGVLARHDIDAALASSLASVTIISRDYEPVDEEATERASAILARCSALICTVEHFGTLNANNINLLDCARALSIPVYSDVHDYLDNGAA